MVSITFSSTLVTAFSRSVRLTFCSLISSVSFLPFFFTVSTPLSPLKAVRPARSPSFIFDKSRQTKPLHVGPSMRCVSVLGAR